MSEKKPWWKRLFEGPEPEVAEAKQRLTYQELVQRCEFLEERLSETRRDADRIKVGAAQKIRRQEEEATVLREALEFYADLRNWRPYSLQRVLRAHDDRGQRARKVLGIS